MSEQQQERTGGVWSALAYFAGVAVVVVLVAWLAPDTGTSSEESPDTTIPVAEATTTSSGSTAVGAPAFGEPVADAAEVILPSVVHIQTSSGLGSGVIYEPDGLIVTAAHVVAGQEQVLIRLSDGRQYQGIVVGSAADVDIAVIRVPAEDLPAARFDTGKPRVGQLAIAVGSPWNLASTVTSGIISAVDRPSCNPGTGICVSTVQTDAAINPGNSGGALVDRDGEVVGINVSIFTESGANDGVGFAVPSDTVLAYADSIVSGEPLVAAFLGVGSQPVIEGEQAGAAITEVVEGSAAEESGILVGDVIVSIDGVPIQANTELAAQIRTHRPGDVIEVTILRDGEPVVLQVTLGQREDSS